MADSSNSNSSHSGRHKRSKDDDNAGLPAAKKTKGDAADVKQAPNIDPVTPTEDPCSSDYDVFANASQQAIKKCKGKGEVTWILYLAVSEPTQFAQALARCKSVAAAASPELSSRLQLDGTRHVTLWEGPMSQRQARQVKLEDDAELEFPIPLGFGGWIPRGAYLQLDDVTETRLKDIVHNELDGLSNDKANIPCNHLSLYRARGMNWQAYSKACTKVREGVPASDWGTAQGVSIRLKVMGSDYSHCRVLAGTS